MSKTIEISDETAALLDVRSSAAGVNPSDLIATWAREEPVLSGVWRFTTHYFYLTFHTLKMLKSQDVPVTGLSVIASFAASAMDGT